MHVTGVDWEEVVATNEFYEDLCDNDCCCESTDEDDWLLSGGDSGDVAMQHQMFHRQDQDVSSSRPGKRSSAKSWKRGGSLIIIGAPIILRVIGCCFKY